MSLHKHVLAPLALTALLIIPVTASSLSLDWREEQRNSICSVGPVLLDALLSAGYSALADRLSLAIISVCGADSASDLSIVSLQGKTYKIGDKIDTTATITNAPAGSTLCTSLVNSDTFKYYAFPAATGRCAGVYAGNSTLRIYGSIVSTSGYDLPPGEYNLIATLRGPATAKDGPQLAQAKSGVFDIEAAEDSSILPSCSITSDKLSVTSGDTFTLTWTSSNMPETVMYQNVKGGGDVLVDENGTMEWTAESGTAAFSDVFSLGTGGLDAPYDPICGVEVHVKPVVTEPLPTPPPPTTSCANLTTNLYLGSTSGATGGQVTRLQNFLIANGYMTGPATGYYGLATTRAVGLLQLSLGIAESDTDPGYGFMGPRTRGAIACSNRGTLSAVPSSGKAPLAVTFTATVPSSYFGGATIDYGDGTPVEEACAPGRICTGVKLTHTYSPLGTGSFKASLTGTGEGENSSTLLGVAFIVVTSSSTTAPSAIIDPRTLSTRSSTPVIYGTADNTREVGLSIAKGGDKFDGTGQITVVNGRWAVTLDNETYDPGTYDISVYGATNNLLTTGTLTVRATTDYSSDGDSITTGSNDMLITADGTWTFATTSNTFGGNLILLDGKQAGNGSGVELLVEQGGKMFTRNTFNAWYKWTGGYPGWTLTSDPTDGATITVTVPSAGSTYYIGDAIPIKWNYSNIPANSQTILSLELVKASESIGSVGGGTWQQNPGISGSGSASYNWTTGPGHLEIPGLWRLTSKIRRCNSLGCQYYYTSNESLPVSATGAPIEFTIAKSLTGETATIDAASLSPTTSSFSITGTAKGVSAVFANITGGYYYGSNREIVTSNGTWKTELISGIPPGTYTVKVLNADSVSQTLATGTLKIISTATPSITANPTSVSSGGRTTVSWTSPVGSSCTYSSPTNSPSDLAYGKYGATGSTGVGPLLANATYSITCNGETSSVKVTVSTSSTPPPAPTNLRGACIGDGKMKLSWDAVTGADTYLVRVNDPTNDTASCQDGWYCKGTTDARIEPGLSTGTSLAGPPGTTYTGPIVPNRNYEWWILARSMAGTSATASGPTAWCPTSNGTPVLTSSPTATLTASVGTGAPLTDITVGVGDTIKDVWSSTGGSTYSASLSSNSGCSVNFNKYPVTWMANTASGSYSAYVSNSNGFYAGCIYTYTYTVTGSSGQTATATLTVRVRAAATTLSPDGSFITPTSGGSLITKDGTWTFGTATTTYGNIILLDGKQASSGSGTKLIVAQSGITFAQNNGGSWYKFDGVRWVAYIGDPRTSVSAPNNQISQLAAIVTSLQAILQQLATLSGQR